MKLNNLLKNKKYKYTFLVTPISFIIFFLTYWIYLLFTNQSIKIEAIYFITALMAPILLSIWFFIMLVILTILTFWMERKEKFYEAISILVVNIFFSLPITLILLVVTIGIFIIPLSFILNSKGL